MKLFFLTLLIAGIICAVVLLIWAFFVYVNPTIVFAILGSAGVFGGAYVIAKSILSDKEETEHGEMATD